jgi:ankyrin repeat protein
MLRNGHLEVVKWLAEQDGVSLTAEDQDGRSPYTCACENGHLEVVKWLAKQDGVSLTAEDNDGWQPIHCACDNGHLEVVKWLAEQDGVSLTAKTRTARSPYTAHAGMDTSRWSSGWRSRTGCR